MGEDIQLNVTLALTLQERITLSQALQANAREMMGFSDASASSEGVDYWRGEVKKNTELVLRLGL